MPTVSARAANPSPLVDIARHCVFPQDIAATRYYELIAPELPGMGIRLDQWQKDIWELGLGVRANGTLCCDVMGVTLSIARQAGKTWGIMVGLIAICLSRPGTTAVWSSHHDRTSTETLEKIAGIVEKPAIRPKMRPQFPVVFTDDSRGVHFANGSRILFGARSSGFGRGFSEVDIQVYDECQHLKESSLTNMLAAMNVSEIGLAFFMGTPPRPEETALGVDEAFKRRRSRALEPKKRRPYKGVYVEFAPEDSTSAGAMVKELLAEADSPGFWKLLEEANPSFGFRVERSAIERLVENMSPEDVYREVLGIWDETVTTASLISAEQYRARAIEAAPTEGIKSFGVKFAPDGSRVAVCGAMKPAEGPIHIEIVGAHTGSMATGTASLVEWFVQRWRETAVIVIDGTSHAGAFAKALRDAGVSKRVIVATGARAEDVLKVMSWGEVVTANSMMLTALTEGGVSVLDTEGQQVLKASATKTIKKFHGDKGSWSWAPINDDADEIPVMAASLALWGSKTTKRRPGRKQTGRVM